MDTKPIMLTPGECERIINDLTLLVNMLEEDLTSEDCSDPGSCGFLLGEATASLKAMERAVASVE